MASKGDIKVIRDTEGGVIFDLNSRTEIEFTQPFHKELFLEVGARVRFDTYTPPGGAKPIALSVVRVMVGTINSIDENNCTGMLTERPTQAKIKFTEPLLKERDIKVGDLVIYDLIRDRNGDLTAVNVKEVGG